MNVCDTSSHGDTEYTQPQYIFNLIHLIITELTERYLPYLDVFVDLVNQHLEEVEGVLLLPDVHSLTLHLEHLPETLRLMVL